MHVHMHIPAHTYETVKTDVFLLLLGNYEFCIIQKESLIQTHG